MLKRSLVGSIARRERCAKLPKPQEHVKWPSNDSNLLHRDRGAWPKPKRDMVAAGGQRLGGAGAFAKLSMREIYLSAIRLSG